MSASGAHSSKYGILDNPLSNDELNSSIIRESQTPITIRKPLETPAQKTLPSRRKRSSITEIVNYISKKYDELALSHLKQQMLSEIREIIKYETDNAPKNDITYLEKHIDTWASEVYFFLREELKEKNLLIKSILNKPESVNRDQHTLCHCKFVSQNENVNKAVTTSVPKVDLTGTEKSNSFKERQPDKYKKEIKKIQNVQDTLVENENTSAEATLGSSQQETTETQTVTLMEETYHRNEQSRNENRNEKRAVLLGDSIIKNINGYELSNQVEKGKIYMLNLTQDQRLDAWRITLNPHQERIQTI